MMKLKWSLLTLCIILNLLWFIGYAPWCDEIHRILNHPPNPDTRSYHLVAVTLMQYGYRPEELFQILPQRPEVAHALTNRPPGYPLLMLLVYRFFGMHPLYILVVQVILNIVGCWLTMQAVEKLFGNSFAVAVGGSVYAFNPLLLEYGVQVLSEIPFLFLMTVNLWLLVQLFHQKKQSHLKNSWLLFLGLVVGIATLIRASMLYLAFLPVLFLLIAQNPWRERAVQIGSYGLGVMVVIVPWLLYNRVYYHTWKLTLSGEIHLLHMIAAVQGGSRELSEAREPLFMEAFARMQQDGLDPYRDLFERGRYYRALVWEHVQKNPTKVLSKIARGIYRFWFTAGSSRTAPTWWKRSGMDRLQFRLYHLIYLILFAAGLWGMFCWREWRWYLGLFLIIALYFTLTAGWAGSARYRLQLFPFSIPVTVVGATQIRQLWHLTQSRKR
jgi:4-amino-4-deoxy-L-arabinose transferase-like glycosyltransferase